MDMGFFLFYVHWRKLRMGLIFWPGIRNNKVVSGEGHTLYEFSKVLEPQIKLN